MEINKNASGSTERQHFCSRRNFVRPNCAQFKTHREELRRPAEIIGTGDFRGHVNKNLATDKGVGSRKRPRKTTQLLSSLSIRSSRFQP